MSELKTKPSDQSVEAFINAIEPEWKRTDALVILELMQRVSGKEPKMWGDAMVGFGSYHYKYETGREGDWFLTGFSPRKANLSIYIVGGFDGQEDLLADLGKHKKSVGCLYVKKLSDIDVNVLKKMIERSITTVKKRYAEYN